MFRGGGDTFFFFSLSHWWRLTEGSEAVDPSYWRRDSEAVGRPGLRKRAENRVGLVGGKSPSKAAARLGPRQNIFLFFFSGPGLAGVVVAARPQRHRFASGDLQTPFSSRRFLFLSCPMATGGPLSLPARRQRRRNEEENTPTVTTPGSCSVHCRSAGGIKTEAAVTTSLRRPSPFASAPSIVAFSPPFSFSFGRPALGQGQHLPARLRRHSFACDRFRSGEKTRRRR